MAAIKKITTIEEEDCLGFTKTHKERSKELFRIEDSMSDMIWLGHLIWIQKGQKEKRRKISCLYVGCKAWKSFIEVNEIVC
jgi:hypothetical protein